MNRNLNYFCEALLHSMVQKQSNINRINTQANMCICCICCCMAQAITI